MPHHVGSLDAWLDSAYSASIGSALGPTHGVHARAVLFGGAARAASAGGACVGDASLPKIHQQNSPGCASGCLTDNRASSLSSPTSSLLSDVDQHTYGKMTAPLTGRWVAHASKRQSLLSLQLRSSSSLPMDDLHFADEVAFADCSNNGSGLLCHSTGREASAPAGPSGLAEQEPACSSQHQISAFACGVGSIAAAVAEAAVPSSSSPSPAAAVAQAPMSLLGAEPLTVRSSSQLVASHFDSGESDAAMFAGSLASSSGGYHSSGSNALHFRDDGSAMNSCTSRAATTGIGRASELPLKAVARAFAAPSFSSLPASGQQGSRYDMTSLGNAAQSSPPRAANSLARYSSLDSVPAVSRASCTAASCHRLAAGSAADAVAAALASLPGVSDSSSCFLSVSAFAPSPDNGQDTPGAETPEQEQSGNDAGPTTCGAVEPGHAGPGRRSSSGRGISYADLFSVQLVLPAQADRRVSGRSSLDSRITQAVAERHAAAAAAAAAAAGDYFAQASRHPRVHGGRFYLQHSLSLGGELRDQVAEAALAAGEAGAPEAGRTAGLLSSGEVSPVMYEGTVRHGFPRKAAFARTVSQPISAAMLGSMWASESGSGSVSEAQ